jgi:hypothetical protein
METMDELGDAVGLNLMKLATEPTQYVHETQVVAMMLQPGVIEVKSSLTERIPYSKGDVVPTKSPFTA